MIVDILMTIFLVLSFVRWEGDGDFVFHAVVGTVFALLVALHIFLNRKWVVSVTQSIKQKKASKKIKRLYLVNITLIAMWSIAVVTGFLAIPSTVCGMESFYVFGRIHAVSSRIGAVIILIHIYQHLGQIRSYLKPQKRTS